MEIFVYFKFKLNI